MELNKKKFYFMLKNKDSKPYIVITSNGEDEFHDMDEELIKNHWFNVSKSDFEIISYLNKKNKKKESASWDDPWGESLTISDSTNPREVFNPFDDSYLVELLIKSDNFVNESFEQIKFKEFHNKLSLIISESQDDKSILNSYFLLNDTYWDFVFIDDSYAFCDYTIFKLDVGNRSFYSLENLKTTINLSELEQFLSIFFSYFFNIELSCLNFLIEEVEPKKLIPEIIIEKISVDNSLYLSVGISISTLSNSFLKENKINKIALIDNLENKIKVSNVDLTPLNTALGDILKSIAKHQKILHLKSGYFIDDDNLIILQEKLAKVFIGKDLLRLAANYRLSGAEKLKKYSIKTVKPKLVGNFKYNVDLLEGDATVEIDGENFSISHILNSHKKDSYIVLSDGTNALINHTYIEKLERLFSNTENNSIKISFFDLPIIEELIDEKIHLTEFSQSYEFFKELNNLNKTPITNFPVINATLREYQEYGYKWLSHLIKHNLGCCLADDMGLGKTLQSITLLSNVHLKASRPSLIIMPKSLVFNWESELKKFAPHLNVGIYYGNNRELSVFNEVDIILTTYGTIRNDADKFHELLFELIILDESQNIKNINAQTTKAIMLLQSKYRLALSGTPIENNLNELYSLFRFLNPGMFGSFENFNSLYTIPIQRDGNLIVMEELRKKISPFVLRRVKKQVLKDLPEKIEQTLFIEMTKEHKNYYNKRKAFYLEMINNQIKEQGIRKTQFYILKALNELRQLTGCPEMKESSIISSKRTVLINHITDAVANGHKVLVFTNYVKSIENICKDLESHNVNYLSMSGVTKDRQALVDKFQKDSKYKVFVMTLKTGGVGLNLTSADTIFIYDPWWNKTVENQAVDRAYRIGQKRTVLSYKLILKDSIEEKILKLQDNKMALLDGLISEDDSSTKFFTENDIKFILSD